MNLPRRPSCDPGLASACAIPCAEGEAKHQREEGLAQARTLPNGALPPFERAMQMSSSSHARIPITHRMQRPKDSPHTEQGVRVRASSEPSGAPPGPKEPSTQLRGSCVEPASRAAATHIALSSTIGGSGSEGRDVRAARGRMPGAQILQEIKRLALLCGPRFKDVHIFEK